MRKKVTLKKSRKRKTRGKCPHLEIVTVGFCREAPTRKPIPLESIEKEPSLCTSGEYHLCPFYRESLIRPFLEKVRGYYFMKNLYYHPAHLWVKPGRNRVSVGLDHFGSRLLDGVSSLQLPEPGSLVKEGEVLCEVKCGDKSVRLLSPVSGTVVGINESLKADPGLLTRDPYLEGWICEIEPEDQNALENLLHGESVKNWIEKEVDKLHRILEERLGVVVADGGEIMPGLHKQLDQVEWGMVARSFFKKRKRR